MLWAYFHYLVITIVNNKKIVIIVTAATILLLLLLLQFSGWWSARSRMTPWKKSPVHHRATERQKTYTHSHTRGTHTSGKCSDSKWIQMHGFGQVGGARAPKEKPYSHWGLIKMFHIMTPCESWTEAIWEGLGFRVQHHGERDAGSWLRTMGRDSRGNWCRTMDRDTFSFWHFVFQNHRERQRWPAASNARTTETQVRACPEGSGPRIETHDLAEWFSFGVTARLPNFVHLANFIKLRHAWGA